MLYLLLIFTAKCRLLVSTIMLGLKLYQKEKEILFIRLLARAELYTKSAFNVKKIQILKKGHSELGQKVKLSQSKKRLSVVSGQILHFSPR